MFQGLQNINHKNSNNFFLIAGPCAIEGEEMALDIAGKITEITNELQIPYIFKGSFKKANRSRLDSFTGIGDEIALDVKLTGASGMIGLNDTEGGPLIVRLLHQLFA